MATKDMTVGKPFAVLLRFSLPILLSMAFQQLYNIVDSVLIGQILGDEVFASVSVSYPVTVLFVAFASGSGIGVSVVTSQLFGEKRNAAVRTCAHTSLLTAASVGAVLATLGACLCVPLLTLLNTDSTILGDAATYLWIYMAGVLFLFLYNAANGIFTALGDSMTPLLLLIGSTLLNVVLDMLLIEPLGVAGAAWATFAAQGASSLTALALLLHRLKQLPNSRNWRMFDSRLLRRVVRIALPSICQQSFVAVGQLFVQGSINNFPVAVQSGYGGAFKINMFTISCITTVSNALSAFTAQNTGARQWQRIRDGRRIALTTACLLAVAVGASVMVFSAPLMSMFTKDVEIRKIGQEFLWTVAPFYVIITIKIVNDGVVRGVGAMKAFVVSTVCDLTLRVIASYALPPLIGYQGIWWAYPIGWVPCTIVSMLYYRFGTWTHASDIRNASKIKM